MIVSIAGILTAHSPTFLEDWGIIGSKYYIKMTKCISTTTSHAMIWGYLDIAKQAMGYSLKLRHNVSA